MTFNAMGKTVKEVDPLGREKHYIYGTNNAPDDQPCLTSATLCSGTGMDLLEVRQVNPGAALGYDVLASYTHNDKHQVLTVTDSVGSTRVLAYSPNGKLASTTRPGPGGSELSTAYNYDATGRLASVTTPTQTTGYTYDPAGRLRTMTLPSGQTLTYAFDELDRLTTVTYPDGTYEELVYERLQPVKRRDRNGRWYHAFFDPLGRVVAVRDPAGRMMQFEWGGPQGCGGSGCGAGELLTRFVDPMGNETRREYDEQGRVRRELRADGTFLEYTHEDATSRLQQVKNRNGTVVAFDYFLDNQLKQKAYSDSTPATAYTYDAISGHLKTAANGTDTLTWAYDLAGHLLSETSTKNGSTVSYGYDARFRTSVSLDGSVFLTYNYDDAGRVDSLVHDALTFGLEYDSGSRRDRLVYPNGIVTSYAYDDESRLADVSVKLGAEYVARNTYSYDLAGNRTENATLQYSEEYGYDVVDQLTSSERTGAAAARLRWAYDDVGNRIAEQAGDAATGATYNSMNELASRQPGGEMSFGGLTDELAAVTVGGETAPTGADNSFRAVVPVPAGSHDVEVSATDVSGNVRTNTYQVTTTGETTTYQYDLNGSLTEKAEVGQTWTYEWNAENQLVSVSKDGVEVASFSYDPLGRRVEKSAGGVVHRYTYEGEDILREKQHDGVTETSFMYVHGLRGDEPLAREDESGAAIYYHADGLGSVVRITDQSGSAVHSYEYGAWGDMRAGATWGGYAFTGREWDPSTGLYYYRARYYDPRDGRFIAEDPAGIDGGVNLFSYVLNSPTRWVDPSGLGAVAPTPTPTPLPTPPPLPPMTEPPPQPHGPGQRMGPRVPRPPHHGGDPDYLQCYLECIFIPGAPGGGGAATYFICVPLGVATVAAAGLGGGACLVAVAVYCDYYCEHTRHCLDHHPAHQPDEPAHHPYTPPKPVRGPRVPPSK